MVQATSPVAEQEAEELDIDQLKVQIKRLNSKAGQLKMDLHDLAEGLPTDYEKLMDLAGETYAVYQRLHTLKQTLKQREQGS